MPGNWEAPGSGTCLGNWLEDGHSFLFFTEPSDRVVENLLLEYPGLELLDSYSMPYEQWQGDGVRPFTVGPVHVVPPWLDGEAPEGARTLWLDPGVVFGTGLHPTTRDCLRALVEFASREPLGRVLDLGTGTGVLALAAAVLGAEHVLAVDLNPLAVRTTTNNIALNRMEHLVRAERGSAPDYLREPAGTLVANIHYDVMKDLVASPGFSRKKRFILSGLLRGEVGRIRAGLDRAGILVVAVREWENTWFTLSCVAG
ncbi:MAG: 50S ribosomal protein L11 methyltransferase [Desulfatibacillaceae bacterium]